MKTNGRLITLIVDEEAVTPNVSEVHSLSVDHSSLHLSSNYISVDLGEYSDLPDYLKDAIMKHLNENLQ